MADFNTRQTLLQKLQNQYDEQAWLEFIETYKGYIYAVILNLKLKKQDADDVAQEVLLQAWKGLPQFEYERGKGRFRSWLAVVTHNKVRDFLSRKNRHFDDPGNERHRQLAATIDSWSEPEIEKIAELEWRKYIVAAAWDNIEKTLSGKMRQVYQLLDEGAEIPAVAEQVNIAENTVYVYRQRVEKLICKEIIRLEDQLG